MSAVMLLSVASALFDVVLAGVWLAMIGQAAVWLNDGKPLAAWVRFSALTAAAVLAASAVVGLLQAADLSVLFRLVAAIAMLVGVAGVVLSHKRLLLARRQTFAAASQAQADHRHSQSENPSADAEATVQPDVAPSPSVEQAVDPVPASAGPPAPASAGLAGDPSPWQTLRLFESALAGSSITISQQDGDLRYTRIYNPLPGLPAEVGETDREVLPEQILAEVERLKMKVLETGEPIDTEINVPSANMTRWFKLRVERAEEGASRGLVCVAVDITAEKESEAHLRSLLRELTHRSRNLLAVIQGIARRTAAGSDGVDSFVDRFGGRLQALAAAHDILIDSAWRGAPLRELVQVQLAQIGASAQQRLSVEGLPLTLKPEAAQHLSLALHELAANAVEHGALSTPTGHVHLTWIAQPRNDQPTSGIELIWREEGGPLVTGPQRSGFGQIVLDRLVPRGLDGEATLEFLPQGVLWRLNFPRTNLLEDAA